MCRFESTVLAGRFVLAVYGLSIVILAAIRFLDHGCPAHRMVAVSMLVVTGSLFVNCVIAIALSLSGSKRRELKVVDGYEPDIIRFLKRTLSVTRTLTLTWCSTLSIYFLIVYPPELEDPTSDNYCDKFLYVNAGIIIAGFVLFIISMIFYLPVWFCRNCLNNRGNVSEADGDHDDNSEADIAMLEKRKRSVQQV